MNQLFNVTCITIAALPLLCLAADYRTLDGEHITDVISHRVAKDAVIFHHSKSRVSLYKLDRFDAATRHLFVGVNSPTLSAATAAIAEAVVAAAAIPVIPRVSPDAPFSVFMTIRNVRSKKQHNYQWRASWGSYIRRTDRDTTLEITLRASGGSKGEVKLQWAFLSREPSGYLGLLSAGEQDFSFTQGTREHKVELTTGTISQNETKLVMLGERYGSGEKYAGWLVQLLDGNGRVLRQDASDPAYWGYITRGQMMLPWKQGSIAQ